MKIRVLAIACVLGTLLAHTVVAAPILSIRPNILPAGPSWVVEVVPDPSLFSGMPPGGSIAVELAFALDDAQLLSVDVNTLAWDHENPGNNPFTGTETEGLWLDTIGDRTFGAFGSIFFTSGDPVELFTINTSAAGASTIRYGEAASSTTLGARIAQAGQNFDGYTGSVTVPEPTSFFLVCTCLSLAAFVGRQRRCA